jgi:hypothetical protein
LRDTAVTVQPSSRNAAIAAVPTSPLAPATSTERVTASLSLVISRYLDFDVTIDTSHFGRKASPVAHHPAAHAGPDFGRHVLAQHVLGKRLLSASTAK